jgi:cytochrome c-type biogenesis protein
MNFGTTDLPGLFATFAAGLLSFLSPCVLPLVPAYLSFISGESVSSLKSGGVRKFPLLVRSLAFVAGFTAVFVALAVFVGGGMGFASGGSGFAAMRIRALLPRIAGALIIVVALNVAFDFIPFLRNTFKPVPKNSGNRPDGAGEAGPFRAFASLGKAILLGMTFAAGWTPCVGPILSSILLFAAQDGDAFRSAGLLAVYSAGLGIPFVLAGLFLDRMTGLLDWFKRHATGVRIVSAILLGVLGLAMLTGGLSGVTATLSSLIPYSAP